MSEKMTIMGAAPKIAVSAFLFLGATIGLHYIFYPQFKMSGPQAVLLYIGIGLIALGIAMLAVSASQLAVAWNKKELATSGFYRVFANPMYSSWVLFIIPGLALILQSWLVLTASLAMYVLMKTYTRLEEDYLHATYKEKYTEYYKTIWLKFL